MPTLFALTDSTLTLGGDDFSTEVSAVTWTPSYTDLSHTGINGNVTPVASSATWSAAITFAQSTDVDGLAAYLDDMDGQSIDAVFTPHSGGPAFTATVVARAGAIGGTANTVATASVTLPSTRPVRGITGA